MSLMRVAIAHRQRIVVNISPSIKQHHVAYHVTLAVLGERVSGQHDNPHQRRGWVPTRLSLFFGIGVTFSNP
jgi:hypothetical protein